MKKTTKKATKKATKIFMGVIGGLLLTGVFLLMIGVIAGGSYQAKEIIRDEAHIDKSFTRWFYKVIGINPLWTGLWNNDHDYNYDYNYDYDYDYNYDYDYDYDYSNGSHDGSLEDIEDIQGIHDEHQDSGAHSSSKSSHDASSEHGGSNVSGAAKGTLTEIGRADSTDTLAFDLSAGKFTMQKSEDDGIYIAYTERMKVKCSDKNGKLYVEAIDKKASKSGLSWLMDRHETAAMTVYLPQKVYREIEISLDAGTLVIGEALAADKLRIETNAGEIDAAALKGGELFIEVNAGDLEIGQTESEKTEVDVDAGACEISAALFKELFVNTDAGSVSLCVDGKEEETSYEAECGMGNIEIGHDSCSGMASQKQQDRGGSAKRHITAECDMGDVEITFSER